MRTQTERFAWFPMIVNTWRPRGSRAIIWLQKYRIENNHPYRVNYKWIWYLGYFSKEL